MQTNYDMAQFSETERDLIRLSRVCCVFIATRQMHVYLPNLAIDGIRRPDNASVDARSTRCLSNFFLL